MEEQNPEASNSSRVKTRRSNRIVRKDSACEEQSSSESQNTHTRWTQKESKITLDALQKFGLTRVGAITELLPNRTPEQVKAWLWRVGREAHKLKAKERDGGSVLCSDETEDSAIGVTMGTSERQKKISLTSKQQAAITKSILLIENLENHPPPTETNDINFKQLYTAIYMSMKGYPMPAMNEATLKFYYDSFHNLLKAASVYPIESFPLEDGQALVNLAENDILNPLCLHIESLKARIEARQPVCNEPIEKMKDWLSKHDWNSL